MGKYVSLQRVTQTYMDYINIAIITNQFRQTIMDLSNYQYDKSDYIAKIQFLHRRLDNDWDILFLMFLLLLNNYKAK